MTAYYLILFAGVATLGWIAGYQSGSWSEARRRDRAAK